MSDMFNMVDTILTLESNKFIVTKKLTSISEEVYESHFPYYPILPAVLLLENIKQSIEMLYKENDNQICKVGYCKKIKLYKPIIPGDSIITEINQQNKEIYNAVIKNQNDEVVCRAYNVEVSLEES